MSRKSRFSRHARIEGDTYHANDHQNRTGKKKGCVIGEITGYSMGLNYAKCTNTLEGLEVSDLPKWDHHPSRYGLHASKH
jgi:hypothetical protein